MKMHPQAAHFPTFCILSSLMFLQGFSINSLYHQDHISGGTATENGKEAICWRVGPVGPHPPAERAVNRTANMAAKYFYLQGFLLLLFNFISTAALEKRFSDFKRCADEECSSKFCSLLLKQIGRISRMHLCIIPTVQLAINCALSLTCCQSISVTGEHPFLFHVCVNDAD